MYIELYLRKNRPATWYMLPTYLISYLSITECYIVEKIKKIVAYSKNDETQ